MSQFTVELEIDDETADIADVMIMLEDLGLNVIRCRGY